MIKDIYFYLKNDVELSNLLKQSLSKVPKIGIGKADDPKAFPFVVFEPVPYQTFRTHKEYQIRVVIASQDEIELETISNRLIDLLHTDFKPIKINNLDIYYSQHMTGGSLIYHHNEKAYEQIMYFNIKL